MEEVFAQFKALPRPTATYHTKSYPSISPTRPELDLSGKVVLITGGSQGIGLASARAFALAGCTTIALLARNPTHLSSAAHHLSTEFPTITIHTYAACMTDTARLAEIITQQLHKLDILLLNAAYVPPPSPLLTQNPDTISSAFETNVLGPLTLIKAFCSLPSEGERTIIHTSTSGIQLTIPYMGAYNASKIAMTSLMHSLAVEQQQAGGRLRVFTFHPAFALTPGSRDILGLEEGQMEYDDVELPAHYAVWLCSPEADFLKGKYSWSHWDVDEMKAKQKDILEASTELKVGVVVDSVKA